MFLFLRSLLEIETLAILIVSCFAYDFKVKGKNELHQRNKGLHFITAQFVKSEHR